MVMDAQNLEILKITKYDERISSGQDCKVERFTSTKEMN